MSQTELDAMTEEELLVVWDSFAEYCEQRDRQMKQKMAEQQAQRPSRRR